MQVIVSIVFMLLYTFPKLPGTPQVPFMACMVEVAVPTVPVLHAGPEISSLISNTAKYAQPSHEIEM